MWRTPCLKKLNMSKSNKYCTNTKYTAGTVLNEPNVLIRELLNELRAEKRTKEKRISIMKKIWKHSHDKSCGSKSLLGLNIWLEASYLEFVGLSIMRFSQSSVFLRETHVFWLFSYFIFLPLKTLCALLINIIHYVQMGVSLYGRGVLWVQNCDN